MTSAAGSAGSVSASLACDVLVEAAGWAGEAELEALVAAAVGATLAELGLAPDGSEVSVVFTDDAHIRELNAGWRDKDKATNVLSFPAFPVKRGTKVLPPMLGDIVLAYETVKNEATLEEKPLEHHLSHLLAHGMLHLLGYDHETDVEAEEMEGLERRVLARLAIRDPYA